MATAEDPDESLPHIEISTPRSAPRSSSPPPPGLAHLFLFIACCAVFLAVERRFIAAEGLSIWTIRLVMYGLCAATAWSALAIVIARGLRGARWPVEPGLYLAAVLGLRLAFYVPLVLLGSPFVSHEAVLDAITCVALVWPLMGRWPLRWKGVALGLLLLLLIESAASVPLLRVGRPVVIVMLIGLGGWLDRRQRAQFSWLHWLGLALWVSYVVVLL